MTTAPPENLISEGLAALRARNPARAADLLRAASGSMTPERMPWPALAQAELALGNHAAAEVALDRQLAHCWQRVNCASACGMIARR
jgi:hypothetical protein